MLPLLVGEAVLHPLWPEAWLRATKAQAWLAHSKSLYLPHMQLRTALVNVGVIHNQPFSGGCPIETSVSRNKDKTGCSRGSKLPLAAFFDDGFRQWFTFDLDWLAMQAG